MFCGVVFVKNKTKCGNWCEFDKIMKKREELSENYEKLGEKSGDLVRS